MMSVIGKRSFYPNDKAHEYIAQILKTGRVSYGMFSKRFEREFAGLHGCLYGVLSNSGTSSLHVAIQALKEIHGWQDGDEVIVPAVTFVATVNVVLHNRLKPVLVDVDSLYYEIDPHLIERAITRRTRAIIPVHAFGQPCEMTPIMAIAQRHGLKVIEDSCECVLSKAGGQVVGSFGNVGCFSTYMAHIVTTGVGGMATTNDPNLAQKMRSLVNHGMVCDTLDGLEFDPGRDFIFDSIGHSFRVTEFESALGVSQLDDLPSVVSRRQANAAYLTDRLKRHEVLQLPFMRPDSDHAFMMYPVVCRDSRIRDGLREHLQHNGIGARLMLPLTNQPAYRGLFDPADYPVADWINRSGFYVGCHQNLANADLEFMADTIQGYFDDRPRISTSDVALVGTAA